MSTQYKQKDLSLGPLLPLRPALGLVAGGAPVTRGALHDVIRAQDSFATSGRRIVAIAHLHGDVRSEILDDTNPATAGQQYPHFDPTNVSLYDRERWLSSWHAAPGHTIEHWGVALPGGPTEADPANTQNGTYGSSYIEVGEVVKEGGVPAGGRAAEAVFPASTLQYNAAPTSNSPRMLRLGYANAQIYRTTDSKADQGALSESPQVFAVLFRRGSSRLHSATISERPRRYVRAHDANWDRASLHTYTATPTYPDTLAREKYVDGTFDEPRYGLDQAYDTAVRQADSQGPVFFVAVFDYPKDRDADDNVLMQGIQIAKNSSGFVGALNGSISTWTANEVGWPMFGYFAGPQRVASHEASIGGATCVVPVRVIVRYDPDGHSHVLRVMTSPRSFVDVTLPSTETWATGCGYLEAQRSAEDWEPATGGPVAQLFVDTAGGDLTLNMVTVEYGHEPWQQPQLIPQ